MIPGSKKTGFSGWMDGETIKIHITEKPLAGKANEALIRLLAKVFDLPKEDVIIKSGVTSRNKTVWLKGIDAGLVKKRLSDLIGQDP